MPTLLQRQVDLLEHLTSGSVIYGDDAAASPGGAPPGMDAAMLRLEAVFSHEKRLEKITAAFPRTLKLLGSRRETIVRAFTIACPPFGISRIDNAGQFFDFLSALWRREPPQPDYLSDVAACELACAKARAGDGASESASGTGEELRVPAIRRAPHVVLQRCNHDVRPLFEANESAPALGARDTRLAIAVPPDAEHPAVFELLPIVFDLLSALDDWTDRREFGTAPEFDALVGDLMRHGLVEVRP